MGLNGTVDYSKGLIYKLCCKDPNIIDIYIGSTTNMKNRKNQHKFRCNNPTDKNYNLKVYKFIRENGGWDNWTMVLVEYVNATSKQELEKEERVVIELLKPTLNYVIPTRTKKEWTEDNKKKIVEQQKTYREVNKIEITENNKKYYEENREKILENQKIYREKNKIEINKKQKKNYEQNKEKKKVKCEFCKCLVNKYKLNQHQQTIKCKKFQFIEG